MYSQICFQGEKGNRGITGSPGSPGDQGKPGKDGPKGAVGDTGYGVTSTNILHNFGISFLDRFLDRCLVLFTGTNKCRENIFSEH